MNARSRARRRRAPSPTWPGPAPPWARKARRKRTGERSPNIRQELYENPSGAIYRQLEDGPQRPRPRPRPQVAPSEEKPRPTSGPAPRTRSSARISRTREGPKSAPRRSPPGPAPPSAPKGGRRQVPPYSPRLSRRWRRRPDRTREARRSIRWWATIVRARPHVGDGEVMTPDELG